MMNSWEYWHVETGGGGETRWKATLDELGRDGWELVTLLPAADGGFSLVLKRPTQTRPSAKPNGRLEAQRTHLQPEHAAGDSAPSPDDVGGPRVRRYYAVTQAILASIADGKLRVGDRLPNERRLAAVCNASRPTVRDALLALELIGVIEIRPGSGAYVSRSPTHTGALMSINFDSPPRELIEARGEIEPAVARLCATRLRGSDVERLRQLVDECEVESQRSPPDAPESFLRLSLQFHSDLAASCGNPILARITQQLVDVTAHPLWMVVNGIHLRTIEAREVQVAEHREVLNAIADGDVDRAGAVMADHLQSLGEAVFGQGRVSAQPWRRHEI